MVFTVKFSQFNPANLDDSTNMVVGFGSSNNFKSPKILSWTTAQRPAVPLNGVLGYNTDLSQYEYWDGVSSAWVQLAGTGSVGVTQVNTGTGLTGGPITSTGTVSFAAIAANSFWANTTGGVAVPTVTLLSTFLLAANNLFDLPNKATSRTNLGVAIGTNVEAWNHQLDLIAAATWPGAASITTLGTITTGTWQGNVVGVPYGGTGDASFTAYTVICAGTTATGVFQNVSGTGSSGQVLTSNGAGALPTWSNTTGSGTVSAGLINQLAWYAAAGTTVSGLATAANGVLVTSAGSVPSIGSTLPGAVQGNITTVGTIGTGIWQGTIIDLAYGGTGNNLTASNGGIVYSDASDLEILAGTATANQVLLSGAATAPAWSTATYPPTTTANQLLYSSATNTIAGLTTGNNGVLITSGGGAPSISSTLPSAVQLNITKVGTIATGVWNGTTIDVPDGGTGNTTFTAYSVICAGTTATGIFQNVSGLGSSGQVLTSNGAGALPTWQAAGTGTINAGTTNELAYYAANGTTISGLATGNNGVLVTSGAGAPSISSTLPSAVQGNISSLGTIGSGVWNGTVIDLTYGGTGNALTASNGGIVYSDATDLEILSGTATASQVLLSGAGAAPSWSTATYPATTVANQVLYSNATNTITGLTTGNNGALITSNTGVPSISSTLPAAVQGNITTVGTITSGVWTGTAIAVANGGTGNTTFTAYSVICAGTTATGVFQNVSGLGLSGQVLTSSGAGALPTWQTATGTGTVASGLANQLAYYPISTNAVAGLATGNNGVLITSGAGAPSISSTLPSAVQLNITQLSTVTTGAWSASVIQLAYGGTNGNLTANNGGIVWSDASQMQILAGTATGSQMLQSGATATPAWSTNTWPATNAQGDILYGSASNVISALATDTNATRYLSNTGSSNNPAWAQVNLANGVTGTLPVANGGTGTTAFDAVVQRVSTETGAEASGTTVMPYDNTIPQNTEGDQYMTLAITPKNTANILVIDVRWYGSNSIANFAMQMALFQDATANALAVANGMASGNYISGIHMRHTMTAGTTSSTTFKIRVGNSAASTTVFNGASGGTGLYNGTLSSGIMITEYAT